MREIKFRAWDKEAGEMIYSDQEYDSCFFEFKEGRLSAFTILETAEGNLHEPPHTYSEELDYLDQFTGLFDKNGKEIWEGDILKMNGGADNIFVEIGFEKGCFIAKVPWLKDSFPELYRYTFFAELDKDKMFKDCVLTEVIGNIYENPELLENE